MDLDATSIRQSTEQATNTFNTPNKRAFSLLDPKDPRQPRWCMLVFDWTCGIAKDQFRTSSMHAAETDMRL
jgi:hypothetical protein